ncbi:MAG TPA: patatin-like phospholipase family protein [Polyangiaceae bacterium]|nr:patatin-like phospholipase family protein [Polyangiaceae bacterium]
MDNGKKTDGGKKKTRLAIACQGGGSHTAFTGGVLQGLLAELPEEVEVVALSGTSGGAICAALAWEGLLRKDTALAIGKLESFWRTTSARAPWDRILNKVVMEVQSLRDMMVLPEVSPYHLPPLATERFRENLNGYFDFAELRELARRPGAPALQIGAVEVLSGHFEIFQGEELCVECLLASAAIPEMFRAVTVPGRGVFWDGLFSQNPPIHDLAHFGIDELWLIQINPSTISGVPMETHEILDRRNSLSGNLSMEQELGFIETFNRAIASGKLKDPAFRKITIERIALDRLLSSRTKVDRSPELVGDLVAYGQAKAKWFLRARRKSRPEAVESATANP